MKLRESTIYDFEYMKGRSINKSADLDYMSCVDYTYTMESDGSPVWVGGFRIIVPTTAMCWVNMTQEATNKDCYRTIKEWVESFAKSHNITRLQSYVRDNEKDIRMIKHFGFKQESIMKNFFDNDDAICFARII